MLTQTALKNSLSYNRRTGIFTRRSTGEIAGCLWRAGEGPTYIKISVCGIQYYAHRLAILYVTGEWPTDGVDHKDGDGTNNKWRNIRPATQFQNITNVGVLSTNKIGLRGVHFHPGAKRFRAMIFKNGKSKHIGYFDTAKAASAAYQQEAKKLHGEFVRPL